MLIADIPYPFLTKKLELAKGLQLAYADVGEGFPLLFIHGLGSAMPAWSRNIPYLSRHYRCLILDLPGYGKSSKEGFEAGMWFYASIIDDFLDKLQLPQCYLLGHSMGGQVAIHTALRFPDRIKVLALAAPAGLETFTALEAEQVSAWFAVEKVLKAGPEMIEQNMKANFYQFPEAARQLLQDRLQYRNCIDYPSFCRTLSASVSAMLSEPVYENMSQLSMPVLIVFGRQDAYIPNPMLHPGLSLKVILKEATAHVPTATYSLLDQCGHFVQFEQASAFNAQLLNFLQEKA